MTTAGAIPPQQRPHELALRMAFDRLLRENPTDGKLGALGAVRRDGLIEIPALRERLLIDPEGRNVFRAGDNTGESRAPAGHAWALIALHHLCAADVRVDAREVAFGDFTDSMGYVRAFAGRIVGRFLATSGRSGEGFEAAARRIGGRRLPSPGVAFAFEVLPRVPLTLVRHEGDDELAPAAGVIYRADAAWLLPAEDRIVAAEILLDALKGKNGGSHA